MTILVEKDRLRRTMMAVRHEAAGDAINAAAALSRQFFSRLHDVLVAQPDCVISGFWPIGDEIDITGLINELSARGYRGALPVVTGKGRPLLFRSWAPGDPLQSAPFGLQVPRDDAPEVTPDMVIAPFLAADTNGYRLGYGGGYYDRTLHHLREGAAVLAIGVGFDSQIVESVPRDAGDARLDWIVTDRRTIECRKSDKITG